MQRPAQTLHEQFRSSSVRSDIDSHMAHDTKETEQHKGMTQEFETVRKSRCLALKRFLLDLCQIEEYGGTYTDDTVDDEDDSPIKSEGRDSFDCSPRHDDRSHERGYRFDELTKGQGSSQLITADEVRHKRVQTGLHDRVTDTKERESHQHQVITITEKRQEERQQGHSQRDEYCVLSTDAVHQCRRRHREDQEPEEHQTWNKIGL